MSMDGAVRPVGHHAGLRVEARPATGRGRPCHRRAGAFRCLAASSTTYRKLAEHALWRSRALFPEMGPGVVPSLEALPGASTSRRPCRVERRACTFSLSRAGRRDAARGIARRHGGLATTVLGAAKQTADLGEDFWQWVSTAAEIGYLIREEMGDARRTSILWRRTKCGARRCRRPRRERVTSCLTAAVAADGRANERRGIAASRWLRCRRAARAAADPRRACRHRRYAEHARPLHAQAYAALERLRAASKLVVPITGRPAGWCRSHCAHVAGGCGGGRKRGALHALRPAGAQAHQALCRHPCRAPRQPHAPGRDRRAHPKSGARLRAGVRPALPRGRSRHRLLRGRGAVAARCRRPHRRVDAGRRPDRQGELHSRQRLVRRL